jgi:hypothetical protein
MAAAHLILLIGMSVMSATNWNAPDGDKWKLFTSSKYHFRVEYPESWYLSDVTSDILDITNFRRSRPDESITLRSGGAEIQVEGARADVRSVYDWIRHDLPDDAGDAQPRQADIPIPNPTPGRCSKLTEVTWRERVAASAYFAETSYYCQADNELYKISLTNWDGDPHQQSLRDLALKIAFNLKLQKP